MNTTISGELSLLAVPWITKSSTGAVGVGQHRKINIKELNRLKSGEKIAESDREIADLQLKQINDQLLKATVIAPFEGVVTTRARRAGFDVSRGDILVTLLDTQNLEVRVFIPIKYL